MTATIRSMGQVDAAYNGDPAAMDWTNRRVFTFYTGDNKVRSYSMDSGLLLATSPVVGGLAQFGIDANGNLLTVSEAGGPVVKLNGLTLTQTYSFVTGFGNTAHGNIQAISGSGANFLLLTSSDQFYLMNTDTPSFVTTGTLSTGKNSLLFAGMPGAGVCYAMDGALGPINATSFTLWKITAAGVVTSIHTVNSTDIDAAWTSFGTSEQWPITTDITDGNLLFLCSTSLAVTNQNYIVKLNALTGAVMWKVIIGTTPRSNENGPSTNSRVQHGCLAYAEGGAGPTNIYLIDTILGTLLSTASVAGVSCTSASDVSSDDTSGEIFVYGGYNSATMGAPTALGSTPVSYSVIWGDLVLGGGQGQGTHNLTGAYDAMKRAWTFTLDGHTFYVLQLATQGTWIYDSSTNEWSKWDTATYGNLWNMINGTMWGYRIVAGSSRTTDVWELAPSLLKDEGLLDINHAVTGIIDVRSRKYYSVESVSVTASAGLLDDVGGATMSLRFSDDQGETWSSYYTVALTENDFSGEMAWRSLGAFGRPGRVFEISDVGGVIRLDGADVYIDNFDEDEMQQGQQQ